MTSESGDEITSRASSWSTVLDAARTDAQIVRVRDLIRVCESVITGAGLTGFNSMGSPRKDAQALVFEPLMIRDHSDRYLDTVVTTVERTVILDLLERRVSERIPVPYLTGEAFFAGRRFTVQPGVFIPRNALGNLLDEVVADVPWSSSPRVLEIGCGSGALGISIAILKSDARVDLVDIDPLAVEVTNANIDRHGLHGRAHACISDMFSEVDPAARYDLVVANLPYVPEAQIGRTNGEIDAEPRVAVYRPGDGLDLVQIALAESALHLADQGVLVLEVGTANQAGVEELLAGRGQWWAVADRPAGVVSLTRDDLKA